MTGDSSVRSEPVRSGLIIGNLSVLQDLVEGNGFG